jgi:hypothetical protein
VLWNFGFLCYGFIVFPFWTVWFLNAYYYW